jgi:hypothetical protein
LTEYRSGKLGRISLETPETRDSVPELCGGQPD